MHAGFQDFRSDFSDFKDFRPDFMNFNDLNYLNGFRPNIKEFRSDVRDCSDFKSGFIVFGPNVRDFRSNLKGFGPKSRDCTSDFEDFRDCTVRQSLISRFSSRVSGIFGRISRGLRGFEVLQEF